MDSSRDVNSDPRRSIPSVHRLIALIGEADSAVPEWAAAEAARRLVEDAREALEPGGEGPGSVPGSPDEWTNGAVVVAQGLAASRPRHVVNATGVVLHTNLGRAPMAEGAAQAAARAAARYTDLELDLGDGRRGNRLAPVADKLRVLSGAEAAYACNNNAAAVLLALNTLAAGKEVIVSRGELVEIGGSFRVPEIMRRAGVRLVEVGSTNRTHPRDYLEAIGPDTAMLLKVHRSNFEVRGFVAEVGLRELVEIGAERGVPVVEDLGSGTLLDLRERGFPDDSYVPGRVEIGPDLICFSGDKLMGGPQAGLVLGRREHVEAMRKNQLARALRLDKMTLAALDWTLGAMLGGTAEAELPVLGQLLLANEAHEARTRAFAKALVEQLPEGQDEVEVMRDRVPVGGGSLPGFELDTWAIAISPPRGADGLAARLRSRSPAILTRVRDETVRIDLRTVFDDELDSVSSALVDALR